MVTNALQTLGMTLVGLGLSAGAVGADTVLEQMQNEVAGVASRARGCIVSIEDARAVVVSFTNSVLEKEDLQNQLAHLLIDRKAAQTQAKQQEERYRAGLITALEVAVPRHELARLDTRLTFLQQKLAGFGRESAAEQQKRDLDARIAELEVDRKFREEQVKLLEAQFKEGVVNASDLNVARAQQAHVLQELEAVRHQRAFQGRTTPEAVFFRWDAMRSDTPKSGSGFSVGEGYIVTTADVVQGMSSPIVTSDDGRRIRALLVALDNERNIGLVRLDTKVTLPGLTLGDSSRVLPGHFAISIGNQSGQYNSVALGLVSGIRTQGFYSGAHFYPELLQVDGAGGAGTSGAPILNARGEVIGMIAATLAPEPTPSAYSAYVDASLGTGNTILNGVVQRDNAALALPNAPQTAPSAPRNVKPALPLPAPNVTLPRPLTTVAGTGFAIPANTLKGVIEELKAGKNIVHVWLGVALDDVDDAREENGIMRLNRQARIRGVYANSPASKVGIQAGDVLVRLNNAPVHTTSDVRAIILPLKAGQPISVTLQRDGKSLTLNLTLETQPTPRPVLMNVPVRKLEYNYKLEANPASGKTPPVERKPGNSSKLAPMQP